MSALEVLAKDIQQKKREDRRDVPYLGYLNLLLFCGTVFVFGFLSHHIDTMKINGEVILTPPVTLAESLKSLESELNVNFSQETALSNFSVEQRAQYLEIHFTVGDLFFSGGSKINTEKESYLSGLATFVLPYTKGHMVELEGHTDDIPIVRNLDKYPSNWELGAYRAAEIARIFIKNGHVAKHMKVSSRSKFKPKYPNRNPAGQRIQANQIKNRRLVLRIGNPAY